MLVGGYPRYVFAFTLEAAPEQVWDCFGFDVPWNGWVSPVVDRETVIDLLQVAEWCVRTEGAVLFAALDEKAIIDDEVVMLVPDASAKYHLRDLGWTFLEVKIHDTKVLEFKPRSH